MKPETALLRKTSTMGIVLWVEAGNLKYRADKPIDDEILKQLRAHKAEIISILTGSTAVPDWCDSRCEHFHRLEVPGVGTRQWCCWETDERHWCRYRLDALNACPLSKYNKSTAQLK